MRLEGTVVDILAVEDGAIEVRFRFAPPPTDVVAVQDAFAQAMRVAQPIFINFGVSRPPT